MKDQDYAENIVRSSILKLLREEESFGQDPSARRAAETALESALEGIWGLRPKAPGSPMHFKG